ncbi:MAG TPA: diaminopimelate decarboxylase, partial [Acidimicrobiaceae bacterium]|nr:diaminopimelate decarboxylase [Acidimicrobiaceae bacterium]
MARDRGKKGGAQGGAPDGAQGGAPPAVLAESRHDPVPLRLLSDTARVGSDGRLAVGGCDVVDLAGEFGTPLFVYDEAHLRARCAEALAAFGPGVAYAGKAFLCQAMARLVHTEGLHLDVAGGGELETALRADVAPERIVAHGNNKTDAELDAALRCGVGRIVVDSFDEIDRIEALHAAGAPVARVLLRVTPGVAAHTHEFVETGRDDSKFGFGVAAGAAAAAVERARASAALDLVGIHSHIGSQVFRVDSFSQALAVVAEFSEPLELPELSIGGGLGVAYVEGEHAPTITEWGAVLHREARALGIAARLTAEPGRAVAAGAALTAYTVGTVKTLERIRTYVAVDGGYGDNPRPMMYGSDYTTFLPARAADPRPDVVRLVGSHCESGDVIVREAPVPAGLAVGDVIATPVTGAYGQSMGSNYNRFPRPAVVFV